MVADTDKNKIRNVKTCSERRKISLVKDLKVRKRFEAIELVDVGEPNFGHVMGGLLK